MFIIMGIPPSKSKLKEMVENQKKKKEKKKEDA